MRLLYAPLLSRRSERMEALRDCDSDICGRGCCMERAARSDTRGVVAVLGGAADRSIVVLQHLVTCEIGILGGMVASVGVGLRSRCEKWCWLSS